MTALERHQLILRRAVKLATEDGKIDLANSFAEELRATMAAVK